MRYETEVEANKHYDLKPCPMCGGKAWLSYTHDNKHQPYVRCWISEANPMCYTMQYEWAYKTEEEAVEAWNRRVNDED